MAQKKSTGSKKKTSSRLQGVKVSMKPATVQALTELEEQGRPVHVIGRLKNGKLEIDQASLEEATKRFPNANWAFIAANAPFDPVPYV